MRVTSSERLEEAVKRHPDASSALEAWLGVTRSVMWRNVLETRKTYGHADPVKVASGRTVTVFNVRGNKYRLLATIDYRLGAVNIVSFLTHAEYDKEKWKKTL